MSANLYFQMGLLVGLLKQNQLQDELIQAQKTIIELQAKIQEMTPSTPPNESYWHILSEGVLSEEAANSSDLELVYEFYKWNIEFASKYVKPYVNPKVFGEVLNQMTRGLPNRIAELRTYQQLSQEPASEIALVKAKVEQEQRVDEKKPSRKKSASAKKTQETTKRANGNQQLMLIQ